MFRNIVVAGTIALGALGMSAGTALASTSTPTPAHTQSYTPNDKPTGKPTGDPKGQQGGKGGQGDQGKGGDNKGGKGDPQGCQSWNNNGGKGYQSDNNKGGKGGNENCSPNCNEVASWWTQGWGQGRTLDSYGPWTQGYNQNCGHPVNQCKCTTVDIFFNMPTNSTWITELPGYPAVHNGEVLNYKGQTYTVVNEHNNGHTFQVELNGHAPIVKNGGHAIWRGEATTQVCKTPVLHGLNV